MSKRLKNLVRSKSVGDSLGIDWKEVSLKEFTMGMDVEKEHGTVYPESNITDDNFQIVGKIVWAHLKEIPDYYTRLNKMEDEGKKSLKNKTKMDNNYRKKLNRIKEARDTEYSFFSSLIQKIKNIFPKKIRVSHELSNFIDSEYLKGGYIQSGFDNSIAGKVTSISRMHEGFIKIGSQFLKFSCLAIYDPTSKSLVWSWGSAEQAKKYSLDIKAGLKAKQVGKKFSIPEFLEPSTKVDNFDQATAIAISLITSIGEKPLFIIKSNSGFMYLTVETPITMKYPDTKGIMVISYMLQSIVGAALPIQSHKLSITEFLKSQGYKVKQLPDTTFNYTKGRDFINIKYDGLDRVIQLTNGE